jgi:tetratricopeptide (TPR) repeat protein
MGEYDRADEAFRRAIEAYQQVIDSGHPEEAPRAAFDLGLNLDKLGEYDLAEQAYQQAINSGHPEVAPKALGNLRGLPMRYSERIRRD